jgi:hypothetical protein
MLSPDILKRYRAIRAENRRWPIDPRQALRMARAQIAPAPDRLPVPRYAGYLKETAQRGGFDLTITLEIDHDGFSWATGCRYGRATVYRIEDQRRGDFIARKVLDGCDPSQRSHDGIQTDYENDCMTYGEVRENFRRLGRHASDVIARKLIRDAMQRAENINDGHGLSVVGVRVVASKGGVTLGENTVWGLTDEDRDYLAEVADDCAAEAIHEARDKIARLCQCPDETRTTA